MSTDELFDRAMKLDTPQRQELALRILHSFDPLPKYEDFRKELDRRVAEHERDPGSSITLEEFRKRIQAKWDYVSKHQA